MSITSPQLMHTVLSALLRRALPLVLLVLLVPAVSAATVPSDLSAKASAKEGAKINFNLPAGEAGQTLKQFAQQAKREILFPIQRVDRVQTNAVQGELTVREGLDRLLAGTELRAIEDAKTGALVVQRADDPNAPRAAQTASDRPTSQSKVEDGKLVLDKYQVTGRQIDGLNNKGLLQGGATAPLYHDVVTRQDIERMGVTSLEELFRLIPQTSSPANSLQDAASNSAFTGGATTHVSTMGLRGFANAQTVILINGRSLPRTGTSDANGPDLGRIPLAAIERVEILPYAGSAIYGAGAIGGAINIILRKEYTGKDLTVYTGTSTEGGASEYRLNYVDGRTFNQGRTSMTTTFSYQHREPLYAGDREYLDDALRRFGPNSGVRTASGQLAFEQFILPAFAGAPGTIVISNTASQTADLGIPGAPGARYATIPAGTTATGSLALTPSSFTSTANTMTPGKRFGRSVLYEPVDSFTLNTQVEHVLIKDRLSAYGEFTLGYSRKKYTYPQFLSVSLAASDPMNPFRTGVTPGFTGRAVTVYLDAVDLPDSMSLYKYESARAVMGLKGKLSERWEWSVDGVVDYAHNTIIGTDTTSQILSYNDLTGQLGGAPAAVRRAIYPLLSDHRANPNASSDTAKYFLTSRNGGTHGVQTEANARLTGEVFELPAGPLKTSLVSKFQDWSFTAGQTTEASNDMSQLLTGTNYTPFNSISTNARSVWQNAVELSLPVIGEKWRPLPIQSFDVQASASYETNKTTSNVTGVTPFKYTRNADSMVVAGKLQLTPDIAFRASYSSAFYPPGWGAVSGTPFVNTLPFGFFPDAARGNTIQSTPWDIIGGGNPNLQPESAKSKNFGVIFTPRFLPGLTLNVDYWRTVKTDAITTADFVKAWSNPAFYSFAVTRAAPTASDTANGWLGVVTAINLGPINAAEVDTEGFDVRMRYTLTTNSMGTFMFNANASFTNDFMLQISPLVPAVNQVGAGGTAPLKWRGLGSLTWTKNQWSTTVTGRYTGHFSSAFTDPSPAYPSAFPLDGGRIPAYLHWDTQVSYEVRASARQHNWRDWFSATKWTLGVNNILNDKPAFATGLGGAVGSGSAFYNTYDDPRQRFVYLQVLKNF